MGKRGKTPQSSLGPTGENAGENFGKMGKRGKPAFFLPSIFPKGKALFPTLSPKYQELSIETLSNQAQLKSEVLGLTQLLAHFSDRVHHRRMVLSAKHLANFHKRKV